MPTPFMHIAFAQRMIADPIVPDSVRATLHADWGAFLLGSIAPDARVSSGIERANTHFFEYQPVVEPSAISAMFSRFPELTHPALSDATHAAFVAGYAGHLVMDQVWCTDFLFPVFYNGTWD